MSSEQGQQRKEPGDEVDAYRRAHALIRKRNVLGWKQLLQTLQSDYVEALLEWRAEHESEPPREVEAAKIAVDSVVESGARLMAAALGSVESGRPRFQDQRDTLAHIVDPPDWQRGGAVVIGEAPNALGFVFQGLHGALCVRIVDPAGAIRLAEMHLPTTYRLPKRVCETPELIGWPRSLGKDCTTALSYLLEGFKEWDWLSALFASDREYRESLVGYYLLLNTRELARRLARGDTVEGRMSLNIPLFFGDGLYSVAAGAFVRLLRAEEDLPSVWEGVGVSKEQMKEVWQPWMAAHGALGRRALMPHEHLFDVLS